MILVDLSASNQHRDGVLAGKENSIILAVAVRFERRFPFVDLYGQIGPRYSVRKFNEASHTSIGKFQVVDESLLVLSPNASEARLIRVLAAA